MLQLVLPPIMYFLNAYPQHRKNVMWLGNLICCLAPIAGGLSTTVSVPTWMMGLLIKKSDTFNGPLHSS